ncbi:MAG TPA: TfoX/Sxy family protein [Cytophagales bacterium]|nr:TfoX/Sxy family protein [Cytophagales bacterium]
MAYSEYLKGVIEKEIRQKVGTCEGKKMMGGYCFFIDDKMCMGLDVDKDTGKDRLLVRIGEAAMANALNMVGCNIMSINGKPMKGFVFVEPDGFGLDHQLECWINMAIAFNPEAKRSKKK